MKSTQVVLVVGSGHGIGKAIYEALLYRGIYVRGLDMAYDPTDIISDVGPGDKLYGRRWYMDVVKQDTIDEIVRRLKGDHLEVVGLVYCIGNNKLHWIRSGIGDVAQRLFETNVVGVFRCLEAFMDFMHKNARVILYSSIAAEVPMRTTSVYCSTKAAIDMLTKCLARELAPKAVFCIKPGPTDGDNSWLECMEQISDMRGWSYNEIRGLTIADIPMKKLATHDQCVEATIHCLFEAPDHASGTVYRLTGGR